MLPREPCPGLDPEWKQVFRKKHVTPQESGARPDATEIGDVPVPESAMKCPIDQDLVSVETIGAVISRSLIIVLPAGHAASARLRLRDNAYYAAPCPAGFRVGPSFSKATRSTRDGFGWYLVSSSGRREPLYAV
jgi:hypothetical protein